MKRISYDLGLYCFNAAQIEQLKSEFKKRAVKANDHIGVIGEGKNAVAFITINSDDAEDIFKSGVTFANLLLLIKL